MNSDLLAMFGGGLPSAGANRRNNVNEGKNLLSFKAGKMSTELKPNGKYLVTSDARKGEIVLMYYSAPSSSSANVSSGNASTPTIKFEWKDRRSRQTVDELTFMPSDANNVKFAQVSTGRENTTDRVYLLHYSNSNTRYFYYMQEKESDDDLNNVILMNEYLSDFKKAATEAGDDQYVASLNTTTTTTESSSTTPQQIDALSSILENLVPPSSSAPTSTTSSSTANASTPATSSNQPGGLTLADLQGAMAGLTTPLDAAAASTTPQLNEVLNPNLIEETGILSNPEVQEKLLALLPPDEENRDKQAYLLEHLRSPQCLESIKTLQNALSSSGQTGNLQNILLNFQLDSTVLTDNSMGIRANPVEVFFEAIARSIKKEKEDEENKMEE